MRQFIGPLPENEGFPADLKEFTNGQQSAAYEAKILGEKCGPCQEKWLCGRCESTKIIANRNPITMIKRHCVRCKELWLCGRCAPRKECIVCFDKPADVLLLCRHLSVCNDCVRQITNNCPIGRVRITRFVHYFGD